MNRRRFVLALMLVASVSLVACGNSSGGSSDPTTPVDKNFSTGQAIVLTESGFEPAQLVAIVNHEVTIENKTRRTVSIKSIDGTTIDTGDLPPGGRFMFTPEYPVSIAYSTQSEPQVRGTIQVEPDEPPGRR